MKHGSSMAPHAAADRDQLPLNVLFGLPDDQKATIIVAGDGVPLNYDLAGTVGLLPHLAKERFKTHVIYLWPGRKESVRLGPGALLNHIGDPDICSVAVKQAEQLMSKVDRPCFNHPRAVARSTRDEVSRILEGVRGLKVPRTIRIPERDPAEVEQILRRAEFRYPVLVRLAGSHLGANLVRIDSADELGAIQRLGGGDYASFYVTEFCDFRSPDGRYRKFRVVLVGEEIILRHCIIAERWLIHRNDRAADTEAEERAAFARFDREWKIRLAPVFREIGGRLGLDYFGIDCNINDAGCILLFEANPCMNIMANTRPRPNMWDAPVAQVKGALEQLLAKPTTWRYFNLRERPGTQTAAHPMNRT
jgi:hypothetical protein